MPIIMNKHIVKNYHIYNILLILNLYNDYIGKVDIILNSPDKLSTEPTSFSVFIYRGDLLE